MADLRRASARREFDVVAMFANIGGFEMAAMRAGGRAVLANEISPVARRIHRLNFPEVVLDGADVRSIAASQASTSAFLARAGLQPGSIDCMVGGSPCNRFSTHSRRHNLLNSPLDTRRLLFDYADVIRRARPLTAIAENVAALARRHPTYLANFLDRVRYDDLGNRRYFAAHRVLCASHYGVPQVRRRTFVIALRADVGEEIGITSDQAVGRVFPEPTTPVPMTVRWALQNLPLSRRQIQPFQDAMARGRLADMVRLLPMEPNDITRPFDVGMPRSSFYTLERCAWDRPAPCLTARGIMPIALSGPLHPVAPRKFCITEIMRLFGVPDDYDFGWSTANEAAERLGLMVPPAMAEALFSSLLKNVLRPFSQRE